MQRYRAKASDLDFDLPSAAIIKEREQYRYNLRRFCDEVVNQWFPLPHSEDQLFCLQQLQAVATGGGSRAIARSRGCGKTQQTKAAALWAALFRHRRYTVPFAATAKFSRKNLNSMVKMLAFSSNLRRLWPEISIPLRTAYAKPNRAKYLTWRGNPLNLECSTTKLVFPHYEGGEGVSLIECAGILEAARGLQFDTPTGETLRPDFLIGDDFQTKASAKSEEQCATRIETICGDFAQMGGPDTSVAMVLNCTVIKAGDAADQLLDRRKHPEFQGIRQRFVYEWPLASRRGMEERKMEYDTAKDLWEKYVTLRKQGLRDGDNGKAASEFYLANRAAMDAGAKVGWEHKFIKKAGEHSAIQHAYNVISDFGEVVFSAEYQNEPITPQSLSIKLTSDAVMQRTNNMKAGEVPDMAQVVVGFVDMNDHALAWTVGAFHKENSGGVTGSIIGYGEWGMDGNLAEVGRLDRRDRIWDEKHPSPEGKEQRFWKALEGCMTYLLSPGLWTRRGQMVPLNLVLIDSGYTLEKGSRLVYNWCRSWYERGGANVMPCRGWPARTFRMKNDGAVVRQSLEAWWRMEEYELRPGVKITALAHDADFHRRQMQAAWTLPPGSPQSLNIYGTQGVMHMRYAQQVACEKLTQYVQSDSPRASGLYQWDGTPGIRNEMGDTTSGCRLAAWALLGDSTTAVQTVKPPPAPAPAPSGPPPRYVNAPRVVASARPGRQRHAVVEMPGWGR